MINQNYTSTGKNKILHSFTKEDESDYIIEWLSQYNRNPKVKAADREKFDVDYFRESNKPKSLYSERRNLHFIKLLLIFQRCLDLNKRNAFVMLKNNLLHTNINVVYEELILETYHSS